MAKLAANKDEIEKIIGCKVYTLEELAPVLGVTRRTLFDYLKAGKLAGVKMAGRWYVSERGLKAFFDGEGGKA